MTNLKKIIVIVGPTAVGKSQVAIHLAKKFGGEILNFDSRQVYREMTIGTAKPSETEWGGVPHHLFDVCDAGDKWDAAKMRELAVPLIDKIKLPFVVGGTGLYIRNLLFGFFEGAKANADIRLKLEKEIEEKGLLALYHKLELIDPQAAKKIHQNDSTRIIRALEVFELTGKPMSVHQKEHGFAKPFYNYLKIGIDMDRAELYRRIDSRVDQMIEAGLEDEVKKLTEKYGRDGVLAKAIGYAEWFDYWDKKQSIEETIAAIKQNSRKYAKRQLTWFRHEEDIKWFKAGDVEGMEKMIAEFL
ncbi:tRNA (adenosine(37)-N6)-dimethylallyltransferase MiaA [bacterium]|nr:tRNA (adenosine(37)-N6)-dimethylallyltransferase MiaA [bacterium]